MYLLTASYLNGSCSMQMKVLIQVNLMEIWIPLYQIKISDEITWTWNTF